MPPRTNDNEQGPVPPAPDASGPGDTSPEPGRPGGDGERTGAAAPGRARAATPRQGQGGDGGETAVRGADAHGEPANGLRARADDTPPAPRLPDPAHTARPASCTAHRHAADSPGHGADAAGERHVGQGPGGAGRDRADVPEAGAVRGRRVAALRRFAAAARRGRGLHTASCAVLLAVALTAGSVAVGGGRDGGRAGTGTAAAGAAVAAGVLAVGDLDAGVRSLQAHLRAQPRDFRGWATLGTAYVEQARTHGDPSRYPQAERALERSLALAPDNEPALAGRAALAAARHDFTRALDFADRALEHNPYSERALCSRIDALVELGRYDEAAEAATTADRRRPGVPVFTRYAYVRELRGDVRTARKVLEQALDSAATPADVAYVATALGQLAWNRGDHGTALTHYARALAADDAYLPALEGRARAQAATGDRAGAIATLERVVARSPLPGPLVALGELYEARGADGDRAKAREQYALVDAWTALARAGGVDADLDTALAAADHGDAEEALRAARAEWDRRHSVHTADAFAWALHVNGRDGEALRYARRATATGYRNAVFLYHRGMIEKAAGDDRAARDSLTAALELNPEFSPLGARAARAALEELEGAR
ncbi:hypothetical protein ABZ759_21315 [Streptomyces sp. NPDC047860]|uniref:tetratricopeptide repeat protein n=1 Tax=Streptomyces sp. NPDC047860 TaxID=3155743 RepID=UPI003402F4E2